MFETLKPAAPDKIIALIGMYRDDPRQDKLDLGVGVYKDKQGRTTIMRAIREAEKRLYSEQTTKTYLGMAGDLAFNAAMIQLVFGPSADTSRIRAAQAPGGSGSLRIIAELLHRARPGAQVWLSDPTWPNHVPLIEASGLKTRSYPYFDAATGTVRFNDMMAALGQAEAGDIVVLHGCCHNPTGANLSSEQWTQLAQLLLEKQLFPFVDLAYQGFGDGLDADAQGVRILAGIVPEMAVAASCSKNFSVYRDRVGAAILMGRSEAEADAANSQLLSVARGMYSMPPDHGAAAVRIILTDADLRADWQAELEEIRMRMIALRQGLADALRKQSNSDRFDFIANHRGMFSRLGLTVEQVHRLRAEHGIYMVDDSRINIAGLPDDRLDQLAKSIVSVL
ncbi:MAG: aspartate/tyrosine/aromatic aminotransferase [Rhizobiaceae bacterium]|nr:aspartate/tyrosine/aromatic aminotransferase [Rhizobiaceae bacterium]